MILTYCLSKSSKDLNDRKNDDNNLLKSTTSSEQLNSLVVDEKKEEIIVANGNEEVVRTITTQRRSKSNVRRESKPSKLRAVSVLSICGVSGNDFSSRSMGCASSESNCVSVSHRPVSAAKSTQTLTTMQDFPDYSHTRSLESFEIEEYDTFKSPAAPTNPEYRLKGKERLALYRKLELVGEGSYAKVYKGYSLPLKHVVALKEFSLEGDEGVPFTAIREASLLRRLRHANIVTLHDIVLTPRKLMFVFEYVISDLHRYLQLCPNGICVDNTRVFFFQLLRGLAFCHAQRILHRDLKPQNLLISPNGELKICDFGLARAKSVPIKTLSSEVVTLWYRSPDVLMGSTDYDAALDCWAAGCILVEMLTGWPLFPGRQTSEDQVDLIFRAFGTPNATTWPGLFRLPHAANVTTRSVYTAPRSFVEAVPRLRKVAGVDLSAIDLAQALLKMVPKARLSAASALCHPFFVSYPSSVYVLPPETSVFASPHIRLIPDFAMKQHRLRASFADSYSNNESFH